MGQNAKYSDAQLDLRVRARHLQSGVLDAKVLKTYLSALPDLEAQADNVTLEQPALSSDDDDFDDEGAA